MDDQKARLMKEMDDSDEFLMLQMRDCAEEAGDERRVAGWNWLIAYERRPEIHRIYDKDHGKHRLYYEFSSYKMGEPSREGSERGILMATLEADDYPYLIPEYAMSSMVGVTWYDGQSCFCVGSYKLSLLMDDVAFCVGKWVLAMQETEAAKAGGAG